MGSYWRYWDWRYFWRSTDCAKKKSPAAAAAIAAAAPEAALGGGNNGMEMDFVGTESIFRAIGKEMLAIPLRFDYNKLNYYLSDEVTLCI